jgi:hypothetical protein
MKIQLIPFRARHVALIRPDVDPAMMALAQAAERSGRGYTACLMGDPIGCAGVWMHGKDGQVFSYFSPLLKRMPVQLFKAAKRGLAEVIEELKPESLYARIDENDQAAVRFITRLGFDPTHRIYERTFQWN